MCALFDNYLSRISMYDVRNGLCICGIQYHLKFLPIESLTHSLSHTCSLGVHIGQLATTQTQLPGMMRCLT